MFSPGMHILGVVTGIGSGLLYGIIANTKFTMEQFEKLGEGFQYGRTISMDI
jgi:hypothetical protein